MHLANIRERRLKLWKRVETCAEYFPDLGKTCASSVYETHKHTFIYIYNWSASFMQYLAYERICMTDRDVATLLHPCMRS